MLLCAVYTYLSFTIMAVDDLIDYHVSVKQCKRAIKALHTHALKISKAKEEKELLPGKEENIWLVLSVKKTTPEKKLKPHKMYVGLGLYHRFC